MYKVGYPFLPTQQTQNGGSPLSRPSNGRLANGQAFFPRTDQRRPSSPSNNPTGYPVPFKVDQATQTTPIKNQSPEYCAQKKREWGKNGLLVGVLIADTVSIGSFVVVGALLGWTIAIGIFLAEMAIGGVVLAAKSNVEAKEANNQASQKEKDEVEKIVTIALIISVVTGIGAGCLLGPVILIGSGIALGVSLVSLIVPLGCKWMAQKLATI